MTKTHSPISPGARNSALPFSPAIKVSDGYVFASGQIALVEGKVIGTSVDEQVRVAMENVRKVLEAAGSGVDRIVKLTAYLTDMGTYDEFNKAYAQCLAHLDTKPARSTIGVAALPLGAKVEIEVVAYC